MELDRNGYAPSIMQEGTSYCYACWKRAGKLDRRQKKAARFLRSRTAGGPSRKQARER